MKYSLNILSDNEYVELMYFSEEILVVISIIFSIIFVSQGLRSALLNFTLGIVSRIFIIPAHCHLLDFDSYAPCNDVLKIDSRL